MKVIVFRGEDNKIYSANSYFVLGDWNALSDVNTLIDVGTDDHVAREVEKIESTGVGKKPVERVILTHGHFDHSAGLPHIAKRYSPEVCAYNASDGVTRILRDGEILKIGDAEFTVMHSPAHSNDSICLYSPANRALFSGDTPLHIKTPGGSYHISFVGFLEKLVSLGIEDVYPGHEDPIIGGAYAHIEETLRNVKKSEVIT